MRISARFHSRRCNGTRLWIPASSRQNSAEATMVLAPYYRQYDLPWEGDPDSSRRFRRLLIIGLVLFVLGGVLIPLLHLSEPRETAVEAVPERLARLMVEEKPRPP